MRICFATLVAALALARPTRHNRSPQSGSLNYVLVGDPASRTHTVTERNNWAVIVDTSRYWYNYRHSANALSFYRSLRRLGFPDDRIILMLAEDAACNARNKFPGTVYNDKERDQNLYGDDVQVDFRGDEVSVDNFLRLLTGRQPPWTPRKKRLLSDENSNIFIFMTGHGGANFLKFRDFEEVGSQDIADAVEQMWQQKRYGRLLFVADTCQASTLQDQFRSPGILAAGSSRLGESSYSHHYDSVLGVALIDRFTYHSLEYLRHLQPHSKKTFHDFFNYFVPEIVLSTVEVRNDLFDRRLNETRVTEFLAAARSLDYVDRPFALDPTWRRNKKKPMPGTRSRTFYSEEYMK